VYRVGINKGIILRRTAYQISSKIAVSCKISYSVLHRLVKNNYQETNHNWKDTLSKRWERLFFTRK